jgi:hypothetical protein
LGTPRDPIISARESWNIGIPPFPHHVLEAGPNGDHPLSTTTRKIRAYLPVGAGTEADHFDLKITNRWKMAISRAFKKRGAQCSTPLWDHNFKKRTYPPVGAGTEADHFDLKITNRWNSADSKFRKRSGTQWN